MLRLLGRAQHGGQSGMGYGCDDAQTRPANHWLNEGILLQGLKSLSTVALVRCCLTTIPRELSGVSALTSLDISQNPFDVEWWPDTMSR